MWLPKNRSDKKDGVSGLVAVAIDKKKESQSALKWAVDNLLTRSATVILIHVKLLAPSLSPSPSLFAPSKYLTLEFVKKFCVLVRTDFITMVS